jgi:hypothetical protein
MSQPSYPSEITLRRYKTFQPLPLRKVVVGGTKVFNDPLKWWKDKEAYFPLLSSLARVYLALQATSAPSERVFSVASRLIEKRRNRLDPELAGKMLFVAENWSWHEKQQDMVQMVLAAAQEEQNG